MTLSATLMGDAHWDGYSVLQDGYFYYFLREGRTEYAPRVIPEAQIQLGKARGIRQAVNAELGFPCITVVSSIRGRGMPTVVHNPWNQVIRGIPAEDGKWFYGDWPDGTHSIDSARRRWGRRRRGRRQAERQGCVFRGGRCPRRGCPFADRRGTGGATPPMTSAQFEQFRICGACAPGSFLVLPRRALAGCGACCATTEVRLQRLPALGEHLLASRRKRPGR